MKDADQLVGLGFENALSRKPASPGFALLSAALLVATYKVDPADVAAFASDLEILPVGVFRPCLAAGVGHNAEGITVTPALSASRRCHRGG